MRRILFPSLGVVVLLLAYAGQDLATGAPSAPRVTAREAVSRVADEAKVLKHVAVAVDRLLESRAVTDRRKRRLVKGVERRDARVEQKAAKIIADARQAQTAQEGSTDPAVADIEAQTQALLSEGTAITQEEQLEVQRLTQEYSADLEAAMLDLIKAQQDVYATLSQSLI